MAVRTILFCLLLILFPSLLILKKLKKQNKQLLPPGPPKLPVLGNVHQIGELPHQTLWKLSKKYGPVILLKFGRIPVVIISSAETAREVLKVHDLDCCSRPPLAGTRKLTYNYSDVAFSPYGEQWRQLRKLCVLELFSLKRVHLFRFIREEEVKMLMNSISQSSSSAAPVDLSEKLFALTGSIVFRMAYGKIFRGSNLDSTKFQELVHATESVAGGFTAGDCLPYVGWIIDRLTGYHAKLERVSHALDTFFEEVINEHLKPGRTKQDQEDIIDVMLKIERNQTEYKSEAWVTKENIKAILLNIFLGGVDTSAITVIWAMAELSKKPRLMKKAQSEIRTCIGNKGRVTESDIDQLQYLKMVIKETMRLHPPAPMLLAREAMSHFKVNGYDIHPKTLIQVNAWAIGRDPNYWKNPEEFVPERFIDNSVDFRGQHFEYLPFGSGRRICPGINMGVATSELALANLLYCFDWKLPNGMKEDDINMEESTGVSLTLCKKTPLILVPVNYLQ
ncbi:Cytochrome P450 [Melia azedarach]|uniref:Cytochrome P450 n=1 Tax=Melia azedarach TaxID=155640 RepID=A0ACC1XHW8_MELAZ|nr:Cytochrome P450 [Melia azedarach]